MRPVEASPPSALYRARKFVRRHRVGVAFASVVLALLVAFAAALGWQAARVVEERDRANVEAATAREVSDFLVGLFEGSDPWKARGNEITAREVLDRGAEGIVLGCTEIGLLVSGEDTAIPLYDTAAIHAAAAVRWMLGEI